MNERRPLGGSVDRAEGATDHTTGGAGRGGPSRRARIVRAWLAVFVWAAVVWTLGGDTFSAAFTAKLLRPVIEFFVPDFSRADMYMVLSGIRKASHVTVYGLLALLILRALWIGSVDSLVVSLGLTAVLVAAMALADEARQAASSVRTGSTWDVLLDLLGAAAVAALLIALQANRRRPLFAPDRGP